MIPLVRNDNYLYLKIKIDILKVYVQEVKYMNVRKFSVSVNIKCCSNYLHSMKKGK